MRFKFKRRAHKPVRVKFAWLPKKLSNGTIVWLETYRKYDYKGGYTHGEMKK